MIHITNIKKDNFTISLNQNENRVEIIFTGKIDIPNPEVVITPFLTKIDSEIISNNINDVYFDVSKLDFINSSGIKVILQYVMNIIRRPLYRQYNIIIEYDKTIEAQKTRFKSILFLAPKIIKFLPIKT